MRCLISIFVVVLLSGCTTKTFVHYSFQAVELEKENIRWIRARLYPSSTTKSNTTIYGSPYELRIHAIYIASIEEVITNPWGHGVRSISDIKILNTDKELLFEHPGGDLITLEHGTLFQIKEIDLEQEEISLSFILGIEENGEIYESSRTIIFEPIYWVQKLTPRDRYERFIECPLGCV